jgi:DNA-binding CsgD family transcriptional regulator
MYMATIAGLQGDLERSTELFEQCLRVFRQIENEYQIAQTLSILAYVFVEQRDLARAKDALLESMPMFRELATKGRIIDGYRGVRRCLILFADAARVEGRLERSVRLLGASASIPEKLQDWPVPWHDWSERILAESRNQLDRERCEAAWNEGRAMSLSESVDYAIRESEPDVHSRQAQDGAPAGTDVLPPDGLSKREVEVAVLLVEGLTNREIGERLYISERTVANHVQHVLNKTGSGNRAEAAAYVIRHGLTT